MVKFFDTLAERRAADSDWYANSKLVGVALGSLAVLLVATLLQVSFGAYPLTLGEAWNTIFDPEIVLTLETWRAFLLGGGIPDWFTRQQLIVWNIRLPRILVGILVGVNLAVSGLSSKLSPETSSQAPISSV